ncbi:aromatic ring-hydroxylating oxygenase subunit alpha [Fodinicurvata fenggangensis]|uniref:aromatic ring-hydroxylating oxygenase subunit alpha n=1 Tax=Fodinicurvata fenggangensis TaxID=1121830 RepID=UPI00047B331D|nr:aromatic ring-hydroxylating dioxygenase subunit alpha [Fodinicurvata fenggangensis]
MNVHARLGAVQTTLDAARGLPNEHYVDPRIFAEEKWSVLFANWSGVGFGKDVPEAGDAKPVEFLGMPLLIVRDRDSSIRVFQNTCRHRGMTLISEPTRVRGVIRCPYHSWCYGLNGALRTTPNVGGPGQNTHPDLNTADLGLIEIRSHVWRDVIFVNVDGHAPPFEEVHADLIERWSEFDQELHHGGADSSLQLDVKANWKLAVENYCESYHLPLIHPGLNSYSRLEDHYNIDGFGHCSGQGTLVYRQLTDDNGTAMPDFPGLSGTWDESGEYIAVYPNVLFGVQRDHAFAILLNPVDCERTIEQVELYYAVESARTPEFDLLRSRNAELWKTVFEEDIFVVEGMQKGRHGAFFDGGCFSPAMDGPTYNFHRWVTLQVEKGRTP